MSWVQLQSASFDQICSIKGAVSTNNHKIIVISKINGIYEYNTNINEWMKIIDYPNNLELSHCHYFCLLSENEEILYLCNWKESKLTTINMTNNEWKIGSKHDHFGHRGSRGMMIDNKLHIIGGRRNNKHLIYDETEGFKEIFEFKEFENGLIAPGIIHVKSRNMALMFGGFNRNSSKVCDTIYGFDFNKNIWIKSVVSMPRALVNFATTTAINNQYILMFGGADGSKTRHEILIYSLLTQKIRESKVKCPETSNLCNFRAVTINKKKENELTVYGFIREQWRLHEISQHLFPPIYLIQVISSWYLEEYIHLIDINTYNKHWRISSLDIVN